MIIGTVVSIKYKGSSMCILAKLKFAILFIFVILLFFHRHNSLQKQSLVIKSS